MLRWRERVPGRRPGRWPCPGRYRMLRPRDVVKSQLDGVDLQREGELVHRRLEREESLRCAWGAIRVDRRLVGRDLKTLQVEVRDAVGPSEKARGESTMPSGGGAVVVA